MEVDYGVAVCFSSLIRASNLIAITDDVQGNAESDLHFLITTFRKIARSQQNQLPLYMRC